ncbi:ABC transporter ATP-binding protein [Bacillus siamensis]|uniref:ABC transporter ATP-binding protein n=1 Tax=Bacillus siamensis TaxID=659243 RepID=UPI002E231FE0|nr:ABC transporter ATP-binding protein [Bacillus siamensis]MED5097498.1 ABC transporter ATP-binding protein [Bacillus siamensis]
MKNIIRVSNLSKLIDDRVLFDDVNLVVPDGTICCLMGGNGVGKSVFLDCLLGFQPINSGKIFINEIDVNDRVRIRKHTGIVSPDHQEALKLLRPTEYFEIIIEIYNLKNSEKKIDYLIDILSVTELIDTAFSNLSFGSKKKIQLIGTLLYNPQLLVCDEIFEGLDEESIEAVKEVFKERKKQGLSTLFTTHIKHEARDIMDYTLLLKNQKIVEA